MGLKTANRLWSSLGAVITCVAILYVSFSKFPHTQSDRAPASSLDNDIYLTKVQPILAKKCIVCHGCGRSPCDLKLDSYEAVIRGAKKPKSFSELLLGEPPYRMKDANTPEAWRKKEFFSVTDSSESLLLGMIEKGSERNTPGFDNSAMSDNQARAAATAKYSCPKNQKELDHYFHKNPTGGMPLGLPGLDAQELETLRDWIANGAPGPSERAQSQLIALNETQSKIVAGWEMFFNGAGKSETQRRLVSRYLYEHVFLSHLSIDGIPGRFFELIRSRTPWPSSPDEIVTESPQDDPGKGPFYYRLKLITEVIVQKSHMVWQLDESKKRRLKSIFYTAGWPERLTEPDYRSRNPFQIFSQIPALARAKFLVSEAKLIANGMIRGPVCYGNLATYAVRDQFWIFFTQPERDVTVLEPSLGEKRDLSFMMDRSSLGKLKYRSLFEKAIRRNKPNGYSISDISKDKVLTIFRHENNTNVMEGAQGPEPKTFWLISYAGTERLYYNLVAQYRLWGSVKHKVSTWRFMSNLRQEYEDEFLSLLPPPNRKPTRDEWVRGLGKVVATVLLRKPPYEKRGTQIITDASLSPISSLVEQLRAHIGPALMGPFDGMSTAKKLGDLPPSLRKWEAKLAEMSAHGNSLPYARYLPEVMQIRVENHYYSLFINRGYKFNNLVFAEKQAREPERDELMALRGIVGDFPNLFVDLPPGTSTQFLREIEALRSEEDFRALAAKRGVLRNDPRFWDFLTEIQKSNFSASGPEAGLLDLIYYSWF